jgi:hypothetical protein
MLVNKKFCLAWRMHLKVRFAVVAEVRLFFFRLRTKKKHYFFPAAYKTTIILLDGKRVKLQLWDTSGMNFNFIFERTL